MGQFLWINDYPSSRNLKNIILKISSYNPREKNWAALLTNVFYLVRSHHEPLVIDHFDLDKHHRSFKENDIMHLEFRADILLNAMGESGSHENYLVDITINSTYLNCHFGFHNNSKYFKWVDVGVAKKAAAAAAVVVVVVVVVGRRRRRSTSSSSNRGNAVSRRSD